MKPNILKLTEFLKKQSGWVVAIILAFCLFTCNGNHSAEIAERNAENKVLKTQKIDLLKSIKKKNQIVDANKKVIDENNKKIKSLESKIVGLDKKAKKQIANMKSYSIAQWKNYYQDVTGYGDKDISVQDSSSLKITRKPLEKIANYLVKAQVTEAKYKIAIETNELLKENLQKTTENYEQEKAKNVQLLADAQTNEKINEQIQENLNKNINQLNSDLKKAKRPKLVPILVGVAGGFILNSVLTK